MLPLRTLKHCHPQNPFSAVLDIGINDRILINPISPNTLDKQTEFEMSFRCCPEFTPQDPRIDRIGGAY